MAGPGPGCRPTTSPVTCPPAAAAATPRRPTSAPTCGARWPPGTPGSSAARGGPADAADPGHGRRPGAARRTAACSTTGTTRRPARSSLIWPDDGNTFNPFLSSVDNGWLATACWWSRKAEPRLRGRADAVRRAMDFGFYYNAAENPPGGQIRGGFWDEDPQDPAAVKGNYRGRGPDVWYTCHHYGTFNTEPRIARYLGIARGQIPPEHYFGTYRTFPDTCDWSWPRPGRPVRWREYLGAAGVRGHATLPRHAARADLGRQHVRGADGAAVRAGGALGHRGRWGVNHPLSVRGQIEHGLDEAEYGYWGFSPVQRPGRRLPRVRRRRARHGRRGLHRPTRSGPRSTSRYEGLPPGDARRRRLRRRRRHPARVVPGAAVRPGRGAMATWPDPRGLRRLRRGRLLRRGRRAQRQVRSATSRSTRAWSWARSATRLAGDDLRRYVRPPAPSSRRLRAADGAWRSSRAGADRVTRHGSAARRTDCGCGGSRTADTRHRLGRASAARALGTADRRSTADRRAPAR